MNSKDKPRELRKGFGWTLSSVIVFTLLLTAGGLFFATQGRALSGPDFVDSFAVSSLYPGQDWHIFVKGSDPGGEMDHIWIVVSQLGGNMWSNHVIRLSGAERKAFSGYITLPTPFFFPKRGWEYVRIEMKIRDKDGTYSRGRVHELEIGSPTKEAIPAEWRSVENHQLGTIFFNFDLDQGEGNFMNQR